MVAAGAPGALRWRQCPAPMAGAHEVTAQAVLDKAALLEHLGRSFAFPDYFGHNWDAAYDLLLDQVDGIAEPTVWRFWIAGAARVEAQALAQWLALLADVLDYARRHAKSLQIEVQSDAVESLQRLVAADGHDN